MTTKEYVHYSVKAVDGGDDDGAFEAILSAPTLDRDGEVIDYGAFDPLPASISILADHRAEIESVVGHATPFYDGQVLKVRGTFDPDPFSQLVRTKLLRGSLTSMSVGFMNPERTTRDGIQHITKAEILEGSFVVIPSNRQAAVIMAKSFGVSDDLAEIVADDLLTKSGNRNSKADQEALNKAHDYLVKAGAACPMADDTKEDPEDNSDDGGDKSAPETPEVQVLTDIELKLLEYEAL